MSDTFDHMVDAYESADHGYDYNTEDGSGYAPRKPTCRYCGKSNLTWGSYGGGYRLFEGLSLHVCKIQDFKNTMSKLKIYE